MNPRLALLSLYDHHALELRSLYAVLKKNDIEAFCVFYRYFTFKMENSSEKELDILVKLLKDLCIDVAIVNVPSSFMKEATKITRRIKTALGIPVMWVGMHPTVRPRDCVGIADFVFRGEIEEGLLEFARNFHKVYDIEIPGLWFRRGNLVRDGSPPRLVRDLDSLPALDFEDVNKYYIEEDNLFCGDPVYSAKNFSHFYENTYRALSSRNCPYHCNYCWNQALELAFENERSFVRRRSVRALISELERAKNCLDTKCVIFQDGCFAADPKWACEFAELYKNKINIPFYCEMHPDLINEELVSLLRGAGLMATMIGIQSGSEHVRSAYFNRRMPDEAIFDKVRLLQSHNVGIHYEIITDNPYETDESRHKGLELLLKLPRPLRLNVFSLNFFPGTEITRRALADGLIREEEIEGKSDRGMRQFILKRPGDGRDTFWNYIYFLASDHFCASGKTLGLRHLLPERLILALSRSPFLKRHSWIIAGAAELLDTIVMLKRGLGRRMRRVKKRTVVLSRKTLLFSKILVFSSIVPVLINFIEFEKLLKTLDSASGRKRGARPGSCRGKESRSEQIGWVIGYTNFIITHRPWRSLKNICLVRSAVLCYFLRRRGLGVTINFGVKKEKDTLKGHSWLTLDGNPYLEDAEACGEFEVIYSSPSR